MVISVKSCFLTVLYCILLIYNLSFYFSDTFACYGGSQYSTVSARNRALAYASKNLDADFHNAKCASQDFGFYKAKGM